MTSGRKPGREQAAARVEAERAGAVADVEGHAAFAGEQRFLAHGAVGAQQRVGKRPVAVRQHVAGAQPFQHFLAAGRRMVDVRHDRQAELLGDLERHVERRDSARAAGAAAHAHLDADDQVAILARHAHAFVEVEETQVRRFADHHGAAEREDAGERDVEIGEDAHRRGLDDVPPEAGKIAGPRRAGVDERRRAAAPRDRLGLDADRRAAPIDVRVQVDHAGRDDRARDIVFVVRLLGDPRRHGGHATVREAHVARRVEAARRVDHPSAAQDQIHRCLSSRSWCACVNARWQAT